MSSRRELLKNTLIGIGGAVSVALVPKVVRDKIAVVDLSDWIELPTFYTGKIMLAKDMISITESIIQLQNEVDRLKRKVGER